MIFLASLPRSGSTLLTSLLNQRSDVFASKTSSLCDTMGAAIEEWEKSPMTAASGDTQEDLFRILKGIMNSCYDTDKLVFDKSRSWLCPEVMSTMVKLQDDIKIVATVRPIAECLASFIHILRCSTSPKRNRADNVKDFCKNSEYAAYLFLIYHALKVGYETYPDNFLLIEYSDLVDNTQDMMDRIADFTGIPHFIHDSNNIAPSTEQDKIWGLENLHKVRSKISYSKIDAREVLGDTLFNYYQGGEFWNSKPDPVQDTDLLDLELEESLLGNFDKAWEICQQLEADRPDCDRTAFNRGWHLMHRGELLEGHQYLARGRKEDVFGSKPHSGQPTWKLGDRGTVLLTLEGGLGDQIHGFRYAHALENLGNRIVVSCSAELAPMFAEQFVTVQHEASTGVYHDFHIQAMSAPLSLQYEYSDLVGDAYIKRTADPIKGRIGVRWVGNPMFEHEQHRVFPTKLMFDAVHGLDCVSLQRDEGADQHPKWMPQADITDWKATRKSISECQLVISSCTSVAHLAAAMGIETWIVVPVLPYYLWALPGNKTPYYDSVTLFRQEKYGDWSGPFKNIKEKLKCYMHTLKMAA